VVVTYVVVRLDPFQLTVLVVTKFVPLTVSVNAAPPAAADDGFKLVIVGSEFVAAIVKV